MPSDSMRRLTKLKSVSWNCTQYSRAEWVPVRVFLSVDVNPRSFQTAVMISGTLMFWKMRDWLLRVSIHISGTISRKW